MAEHICVEQEFLLPIPDGLDLTRRPHRTALSWPSTASATAVPWDGVTGVVVSGPGIIGMFWRFFRPQSAGSLTGTEQDETTRLSAARTIGFETLMVGHGHPPLHEQITAYFPDGADALVEASGSAHALADSWQSVRPDGVVTAVALYSRTIDFDLTQFGANRSISVPVMPLHGRITFAPLIS